MHTPKRAGIPYNVGFMLGTEVRTTRSLTYWQQPFILELLYISIIYMIY